MITDSKDGTYRRLLRQPRLEKRNPADVNVQWTTDVEYSSTKYVSFSVGGAITINSVPEREYEECLLKAKSYTLFQSLCGKVILIEFYLF